MSTPEHQATDSDAENPPVVEHESTSLWPIDDPEQTSHIQRPPVLGAPDTTEPPAPAPATAPEAAAIDPEATTVTPLPSGNYTQPWTSTTPAVAPGPTPGYGPGYGPPSGYGPPPTPPAGYGTPATPAPGYDPAAATIPHGQPGYYQQTPQPGSYPHGAGHQPTPGYPAAAGACPPGPNYAQPQQPNQLPVSESPTGPVDFTPKSGGRRKVILLGSAVAVAVIAAIGVTGFWKPGFFVTRQLNITKVTEGVQHILTDPNAGYGITGVSGLLCNDGKNPSGDQGTKFSCSLTVNGAKHNVEITVVDDHGTYQVGKVT